MTAFAVVVALLLVAANGFFVAAEFAIARIRPSQIAELEAAGTPGVRALRHAVEHLDSYLAACQLGITVASIGLGFVGKPAFETAFSPIVDLSGVAGVGLAVGLAFAMVTLLHVVFGELAPKSLAVARTSRTALVIAPPMRIFYAATKPVVDLFNAMGNLTVKPFGIPPASEVGHTPHTEEELRLLLRESLKAGLIEPVEQAYAENVLVFGDRRARQIMVPRPEIDFVSTNATLRDAALLATSSGHTRLPICDPKAGLEAPLGVINAKDLLDRLLAGTEPTLVELARPLRRVSESTRIDELLVELRRTHHHIVLVADEHGTTVGLVTLEDILEELVGEIEDEFDSGDVELFSRDQLGVRISGAAPLEAAAAALRLKLDPAEQATLGGYVVEVLGHVPEIGEIVDIDGHRLEVTAADGARILELRVLARDGSHGADVPQ
jgi:CBS domain containing-hemolysin-like protein